MSYAHKQRKKKLKNKEIVFPQGGKLCLVKDSKPDAKELDRLAELKYKYTIATHPRFKNENREEMIEFYRQSLDEQYSCPVYTNDVYQIYYHKGDKVADEIVHQDNLKGKMTYLSIKRHDKQPCNDWQDFQTIKNTLCGDDTEAIQIYPAEYRLMNSANQYHLIVFPANICPIPFGFMVARTVIPKSCSMDGAVQTFRGKDYKNA